MFLLGQLISLVLAKWTIEQLLCLHIWTVDMSIIELPGMHSH